MEFVRTPEHRFSSLKDYAFEPHYLSVADGEGGELRLHYLDEGNPGDPLVLLMHGQPSWSYLYRHMIPLLVSAGYRVVAPDLIGFGRSDKPTLPEDYSYAAHVGWMSEWLTALDLNEITLFCQDWGGLIGLRLVAAFPDRFANVVVANTGLPTGMVPEEYAPMLKDAYKTLEIVEAGQLAERFRDDSDIPGFLYWRKYCAESPVFDVGDVLSFSAAGGLPAEVLTGYCAPFPDQRYMAGARRFPSLVPVFHDEPGVEDNNAAWRVLEQFEKPVMTAFSDKDPVTAGGEGAFQMRVPGCAGVAHRTIENAGHFLQEDAPQACVQAILDITAAS
jgi:haloalkane dehalogenase